MRLARHLSWPITALVLLPLLGCDKPSTPTDSAANAQQGLADGRHRDRDRDDDDEDDNGTRIPFDDAEVFFEFNTTANDLGLQVFLDAEGWKKVRVSDPRGREIVQVMAQGPLSQLGITELRFESAEPSPAEVLALFRPGDYRFRGKTADGDNLVSTATLSHDFLPAPTFSPSNGQVVDPNNTVVTWNAPGAERVEVILENADLGHLFDVTVAGTITSLNVPPQFLRRGVEYKIEILAIAENGNRTIVEGTFVTRP